MALPNSREQLKRWALRKIGDGVIGINVSAEQIEDRVDEAIERFQEHHYEGVERMYLKREITASVMKFDVALAFTFDTSESFIGQTSGAKGRFVSQASDDLSIEFFTEEGTFVAGEDITGDSGTATISSASDAITLGDKDNGWVPVDDSIIGVVSVVTTGGLLGSGLYSYTYQQALQFLPNFPTGGLTYFYQQKQHLALIEELFVGEKIMEFHRMLNRITVDINWKDNISVGDFIIFDVYKAVDPTVYTKVYGNWFVREYTAALIMEQWGRNLGKFKDVEMLNGTTLNGDGIAERAKEWKDELEEKLRNELQEPPGKSAS